MKKILSLIIVFVLLVGIIPLNAFAYNEYDSYDISHEIDSMFSASALKKHPHAGYYETRNGEEVYLDKAYHGRCEYCIEQLCYEFDAHSCLYDFRECSDRIEFECFCGKIVKVSFRRLDDFFEDRKRDNVEICEEINFDFAEKAYYERNDEYEVYEEYEPYREEESAASTLGGTFDGPMTSADGKVYISSNLTSNYQITSVYVYVVDSNGSKVRGAEITPYSKSVVIDKNSYLNQQLCLETLSTGTYDVYMEIKDSSGTTGSASANFNITQPDCKPAENSTLTITFTCLPKVIREKGGFGLRGEIVSNYTITSVYGYLKDMNGNVLDSSYDSPNSTYMDIKSAKLNQDLTFNILSNGRYKIVAIAYDASGAEVTLEHEFTVDRPSSSSSNNSSSLIDGKYTVEQWNELFAHIIYYNNFEPCYMDVKTGDATIHITALDASDKIGYPAKGTTLPLIGKVSNKYNNIWYITEYNGKVGYIWSGDLKPCEVVTYEEPDVADIILNGTSDALTVISLIPVVDTFANLLQIPVDILRDDWVSAGLSLAGAVPIIGEAADATKTVRLADKSVDAIKAAKKADKISDVAKLSKRSELLNTAKNPKLKNAINEIYREGAKIGDGGLADAIRYELQTGNLVGGKSHIQKGKERVKNLENIIKHQNLDSSDMSIANELLADLIRALEGQ